MKKLSAVSFILAVISLVSFTSPVSAGQFKVDAMHSNVDFSIRHLVSKVNGRFKDFEGTFHFDEKKSDDLKDVKFTVKTTSISTDNDKRDGHLRSGDFFDVEKFPEMSFVSQKVTKAGKNKFNMEGTMTLHGVSKPATFMVEFLGATKDMQGGTAAGFTATTKLNRKDYGIIWNKAIDKGGFALGDDVNVEINVEAHPI